MKNIEHEASQPFQQRVQPWMLATFGEIIAGDRAERNHRFLEESLELAQACGCTASEAHQLVDYVFGRTVGEPAQEVGGVMVTLAALCLANDLDMHAAGETELARIWTKVDAIRAKQAAKPKHSPLPQASQPVPQPAPVVWQEPIGYAPTYLAERLAAGDAGVMLTVTRKPLPGHGVTVALYTAPVPAASVQPTSIDGQSQFSRSVLHTIYHACQRGDSPERLHAAVMAEFDKHSDSGRDAALVEYLVRYKHCMSYNDSYFSEPAGELKRMMYAADRAAPAQPPAPPVPVMHNPYTGAPRDPRDIASDPGAVLCVEPGKPIKAAGPAKRPMPPGDQALCNDGSDPNWAAHTEAGNTDGAPESECGACHGLGWVSRDPDIGTEQECFSCGGSGEAESAVLTDASRQALQAEGKHPAPCARHCEAPAFQNLVGERDARIAELEAQLVRRRAPPSPEAKQAIAAARAAGQSIAATPEGLVFMNDGAESDYSKLDCPACGGSGHAGDVKAGSAT